MERTFMADLFSMVGSPRSIARMPFAITLLILDPGREKTFAQQRIQGENFRL
jgi:hypothetical protein